MDVLVTVEGWAGLHAELRDLSLGGFALMCMKPFSPGMTQDFTFTVQGGFTFSIVAKAVHCSKAPDGFLSGWQFCRQEGDNALIHQLVHHTLDHE